MVLKKEEKMSERLVVGGDAVVRSLGEWLKDDPTFPNEWKVVVKTYKDTDGCEKKSLTLLSRRGRVVLEGVQRKDGVRWDQWTVFEAPSTVFVPYYKYGKSVFVGFLMQQREIIINSNGTRGAISIELPRGIGNVGDILKMWKFQPIANPLDSRLEELYDETFLSVTGPPVFMGKANINTSNFATSPEIWAVEVDRLSQMKFNPDRAGGVEHPESGYREKILGLNFYEFPGEVHGLIYTPEFFCGMTFSALFMFSVFMKKLIDS